MEESDFREAFNAGNDYEKSNMKNECVETYYKDRTGPGLVEEYSSKLWKSQIFAKLSTQETITKKVT